MHKKLIVWFVDDLDENLQAFADDHMESFTIRTFNAPQDVLDCLDEMIPDALLCDIFFYENPKIAQNTERKISEKEAEIRRLASEIGALGENHEKGITLIKDVSEKFRGNMLFPVYAYTSKGHYILDGEGLDQLAEYGATFLFKKRHSPEIEELIIRRDIEDTKRKQSIQVKLSYKMIAVYIVMIGVVLWIISRIIDYIWSLIFSA